MEQQQGNIQTPMIVYRVITACIAMPQQNYLYCRITARAVLLYSTSVLQQNAQYILFVLAAGKKLCVADV